MTTFFGVRRREEYMRPNRAIQRQARAYAAVNQIPYTAALRAVVKHISSNLFLIGKSARIEYVRNHIQANTKQRIVFDFEGDYLDLEGAYIVQITLDVKTPLVVSDNGLTAGHYKQVEAIGKIISDKPLVVFDLQIDMSNPATIINNLWIMMGTVSVAASAVSIMKSQSRTVYLEEQALMALPGITENFLKSGAQVVISNRSPARDHLTDLPSPETFTLLAFAMPKDDRKHLARILVPNKEDGRKNFKKRLALLEGSDYLKVTE